MLLVMYDLPMQDAAQRREAQSFRKKLLAYGYRQMQESLYVKLLRNISGTDSEIEAVQKIAPKQGVVQVLPLNLQTFRTLRTLTGDGFDMGLFADDLVFL